MGSLLRRVAAWAVGGLIWLLLWMVRATWRVRVVGHSPPDNAVIALWHGHLVTLCPLARRATRGWTVLVSRSSDGQWAAHVARQWGLHVIRGSRSRDGIRASRALVRALRAGRTVAVAVDGPRGPRQRADDSLIRLARLADRPVVPLVGAASAAWRLSSWDQLAIPAPFSRVLILWGQPVQRHLEQHLVALQRRAEDAARARGACYDDLDPCRKGHVSNAAVRNGASG